MYCRDIVNILIFFSLEERNEFLKKLNLLKLYLVVLYSCLFGFIWEIVLKFSIYFNKVIF